MQEPVVVESYQNYQLPCVYKLFDVEGRRVLTLRLAILCVFERTIVL
jgi:hypothetical protein